MSQISQVSIELLTTYHAVFPRWNEEGLLREAEDDVKEKKKGQFLRPYNCLKKTFNLKQY